MKNGCRKELVKDNELPIKHRIASSSENNARGVDAVPMPTEQKHVLLAYTASRNCVSAGLEVTGNRAYWIFTIHVGLFIVFPHRGRNGDGNAGRSRVATIEKMNSSHVSVRDIVAEIEHVG